MSSDIKGRAISISKTWTHLNNQMTKSGAWKLLGSRHRLIRPKVLLLDEPTAALDAASVAAVEAVIASRIRAGLAVLWVTHDAGQARRIARRQLAVEAGRVREEVGQ